MFKAKVILMGLLWLAARTAFAAAPCAYVHLESGQMSANKFYTAAWGCVVQITPLLKPDLHYREYYFDERGRFMVLNSVAGDTYETSVSLNSYFFFPHVGEPSVDLGADGTLRVTSANGTQVLFAKEEPRVLAFAGVKFSESTVVDLDPAHRFQVLSSDLIYLEVPAKVGGSAYLNSADHSTFKSPAGRSCVIQNNELFSYEALLYAEPNLRYGWDRPIEGFFESHCPGFLAPRLRFP